MIDFKGSWDDHLPLIEFAYNNSYHSSIQIALYEALYGRKCRSPVGWFEVGEVIYREFTIFLIHFTYKLCVSRAFFILVFMRFYHVLQERCSGAEV